MKPARSATDTNLADCIVVHKAARELLLFSGQEVIRRYPVALGRTPVGAKRQQGDGKTPEGNYVISGRNAASKYHKSLRVSYPDAEDHARAEREGVDPGGDIMIHGWPNGKGAPLEADWTQGCIAVTDDEIDEIWQLVPDGTPIQIHP